MTTTNEIKIQPFALFKDYSNKATDFFGNAHGIDIYSDVDGVIFVSGNQWDEVAFLSNNIDEEDLTEKEQVLFKVALEGTPIEYISKDKYMINLIKNVEDSIDTLLKFMDEFCIGEYNAHADRVLSEQITILQFIHLKHLTQKTKKNA